MVLMVLALMGLERAVRNGWDGAAVTRTELARKLTADEVDKAMDLVRQWVELNGLGKKPAAGG